MVEETASSHIYSEIFILLFLKYPPAMSVMYLVTKSFASGHLSIISPPKYLSVVTAETLISDETIKTRTVVYKR